MTPESFCRVQSVFTIPSGLAFYIRDTIISTIYLYFGVNRFDRASNKRIHIHSLSGLLHADHREPSLDYEILMRATWQLTRDIRECEKQLRAAVFNVLSHNRDDHAKNFSFRMDDMGLWSVSPAYDLTCSTGPSGEHATLVMREGKNPTRSHLLRLAALVDIKETKAIAIIEEVASSIAKWKQFARVAGVTPTSEKMIQAVLNDVTKSLLKK
jgi:serine/threonine-protein kinase HipA